MTDAPLPLNALAARQQLPQPQPQPQPQPLSAPTLPPPAVHVPRRSEARAVDGGAEDEDDGEIICICRMRHDDGFSVQCETCNNWQHMICYYPNESDRPGEHQKHYCFDCQPRWLDEALARERQEKQLRRQAVENGSRRPGPKGHRKKAKDSVNGWSADKHQLLQGRDRKSQSPRDQPPPAKRPKTNHRSSVPAHQPPTSRKRNGTVTTTRSTSPDPASRPIIPWYSDDFCHLYKQTSSHVETQTNLMNNIAVTNSLSEWLKNPDAVENATNGLSQNDIFQRWDGPFEDMPGRPEVALHWEDDHRFSDLPNPPRWPCLTVEQDISKRTFIGELRGHIGYKEDYMNDPDSRWSSLRHVEPFVFFHPQLPIYIDARQEGTVFRYVRRSCRPNTELQTIITDGTNYHFCFMATKDLLPGEEITVAWQTDDTIKAMYAERGVVHGDVPADIKYAIAMWVSNVLANCGPCACNGEGCLMARFDRRGQPQPLEPAPAPVKSAKPRKKKLGYNISPTDPTRNSNSRSGSEARRLDQDDDMTDTHSVSGSYRGSASRDITPNTHYSATVPEMSERERKKLMREEEMFRRQEEESGRQQKKKRNSGASSLQPPNATPAANTFAFKQPSEPSTSRRNTISKRSLKTSRSGAKQSPQSEKPPRPLYVNSAVQCDMDNDEPPGPPMPTPPKRKQYLSVTQRLLRRCASNNLKRKADTSHETPVPEVAPGDTMDVDKEESPKANAETSDVIPLSPVSIKATDIDMGGAGSPVTAPLSPAFGQHDEDMKDSNDYAPRRATPPLNDVEPSTSTNAVSPTLNARIPAHPPMDPPPPPWVEKEASNTAEDKVRLPETKAERPEMQLIMPPPNLIPTSSTSSGGSPPPGVITAGGVTQSPAVMTPGVPGVPLFSPSVTASVNPSPARKKMSLSDYTKRSKARETTDICPAAGIVEVVTDKDTDFVLQGTAISDSPAPEIMVEANMSDNNEAEYVPPPA